MRLFLSKIGRDLYMRISNKRSLLPWFPIVKTFIKSYLDSLRINKEVKTTKSLLIWENKKKSYHKVFCHLNIKYCVGLLGYDSLKKTSR